MDLIFNYLFIGCILSFALDHYTIKYQKEIKLKNIHEWTWPARILFIILWPIGVIMFVFSLINEFSK